jgi:uncharacterized protein (DUF2249 family)
MDDHERREKKVEAYTLEELEESGFEKVGDPFVDVDEELVLVGDHGPVPYRDLLTEEEYQAFRELAEKGEPTEDDVIRGQDLLRLMMKRCPGGPASNQSRDG